MRAFDILTTLLQPALLIGAFVYFWRRRKRPDIPLPPSAFNQPASEGWARVTGYVYPLPGLGMLGWQIRYPLPDGSWGELFAPYTRPSALSEGMAVPVLVDLRDPGRARLDVPGHTLVISILRRAMIGLAVAVAIAIIVNLLLLAL